jgi:hypothetical protein
MKNLMVEVILGVCSISNLSYSNCSQKMPVVPNVTVHYVIAAIESTVFLTELSHRVSRVEGHVSDASVLVDLAQGCVYACNESVVAQGVSSCNAMLADRVRCGLRIAS